MKTEMIAEMSHKFGTVLREFDGVDCWSDRLSGVIYERGVDDRGFGLIRSKGDQALFGGFSTNDMKRKLSVPKGRALADFLPTLTIKAKDFATELTSHNVIEKDLHGEGSISKEHVDNNAAVRKIPANAASNQSGYRQPKTQPR